MEIGPINKLTKLSKSLCTFTAFICFSTTQHLLAALSLQYVTSSFTYLLPPRNKLQISGGRAA